MTAQPSLPPPPLLPASGLSQQTAREHVPRPGSTCRARSMCPIQGSISPGPGAQPWAVEHKPGPWAQVQAKDTPGRPYRGCPADLLFPSLPSLRSPCEPLGPAAGAATARKDTHLSGAGLRHPHGAPDNPDPTERGSAHSECGEAPFRSDGPWGGAASRHRQVGLHLP